MKSYILACLTLVVALGVIAGCTDKVEETLDPDLKMTVHESFARYTSPAPGTKNASEGKEFLYIKINITNNNEKTKHTVWNADLFSVDDNGATQVEGAYLANLDMREIDSIAIDEGTGKTFYAVFEVPDDMDMKYIRYEPGIDEPLDAEIPAYDHYTEKV